jgi:hypothetical protein
MVPRERVLAAVNRRMPDRRPVDDKAEPEGTQVTTARLRCGSHAQLLDRLTVDILRIEPRYAGPPSRHLPGDIPGFIALGIDNPDPIQVMAKGTNPAKLKRDFGGKLAFQDGYFLAPSHNIQPDTSVENIQAMYECNLR